MVTVWPSANVTLATPGGLSGGFLSCAISTVVSIVIAIKVSIHKRPFCIALSSFPVAVPLFTLERDSTIEAMGILDEKREELDQYEFMMGTPRGRLAVALDVLTDALTMVGQHGVYCQSARQPGKPAMDIQIVMKEITDAKELISSVMEEIRRQKEEKK